MLQYVVAEAAEAGITDVIVVTSPGKEGIAEYFPAPSRPLRNGWPTTPRCWRR